MYSSSTPQPIQASSMLLPMAASKVQAGFPSPADDHAQSRIDITKLVVHHPQCTFLLRLTGDSMSGIGLMDGDILVVDKYMRPMHGDIVIAEIAGDFTCKRYLCRNGQMVLRPENPTYPDIRPKPEETIEIWGVVTGALKQFRTA